MDSPKKKKINWDDYRIRFHQYGEDYHYGSGESWNYHSEAFPIVEGAEYVWLERRIRIDKIKKKKEEISFTYFAKLSETFRNSKNRLYLRTHENNSVRRNKECLSAVCGYSSSCHREEYLVL